METHEPMARVRRARVRRVVPAGASAKDDIAASRTCGAAARLCFARVGHSRLHLTPPHTVYAYSPFWPVLLCSSDSDCALSSHLPLLHPPAQASSPPDSFPSLPTLHHGLAQHLQQWPKHHPELPKRRQCSAAIRSPSKLAHLRAMGCLHRGCPARQRISARWRQRERLEGSEHRRYVGPSLFTLNCCKEAQLLLLRVGCGGLLKPESSVSPSSGLGTPCAQVYRLPAERS